MTMLPAQRFYAATTRVARRMGDADRAHELLLRFGLPGLMYRLGIDTRIAEHEGVVRLYGLSHTLLMEAAREISNALEKAAVPHFFAKGIALLGPVYRVGDRLLADIDVYVPLEHREDAVRVIQSLDYLTLPEPDQAGPADLRSALGLVRQGRSTIERVDVDLHWGLDPVERLLPRRDRPIPQRVWGALDHSGPLPVPSLEHHAAILAHHLVHTDLLHVRSLLDMAFVFDCWQEDGGREYLATCQELRIGRFAIILAQIIARDFGIERPNAMADGAGRLNRLTKYLDLDEWLALVSESPPGDDNMITVGRIRRRLQLVDEGGASTLFGDLFFPPEAFLRWRWPTEDLWGARLEHYRQLARKALSSLV